MAFYLTFGVLQEPSCCGGDGIDAEQCEAVAGGTTFGCTEIVAAVEAGHAGEIQADNNRLLIGFCIWKWSPCLRVCQAKDGDGGGSCCDGKVDERRIIADEDRPVLRGPW